MAVFPVQLKLFGAFNLQIDSNEQGNVPKPAQELLAQLVMAGQSGLDRSQTASSIWPDADDERAQFYLRRSLTQLRSLLGPERWRLESIDDRRIGLNLSDCWCDLRIFRSKSKGQTAADQSEAAGVYNDDLLLGHKSEWVRQTREALRQTQIQLLISLADHAESKADLRSAQEWLKKAIQVDPLSEVTVRRLMNVYGQRGEYSAIAQLYRELRQSLRQGVGLPPSRETIDLYREFFAKSNLVSGMQDESKPSSLSRGIPLPRFSSPFIGRQVELGEIRSGLTHTRILTITGLGGVGKSRLALQTASVLGSEGELHVRFADLSSCLTRKAMEDKVAAALGVSDVDRDLQRMLNEAKEPYLLVLDGAERVSVFCRELVDVITSSAGDLKFICTSQTPLLAADELLVHLLPMSLVPSEEQEGGLSEAERLFLSCASRAAPGFKTNEKNRCQVRELCVRLDGLPLALELAATRLRTLPIVELIANLEDRFSLLDQGRSNEDGQRTLRGVLDWSLGSLPELESRLFVSLGVFPASWTTAAVQGVCFEPKIPREQLIAALSVLVDRSLVTFDAGLGGGVYRMLETVRLYARSHLPADEPSTNELNLRHAKFYLEAARNASLQVEAPPEFVSDQPNYAQAIDFYLNSSKPEVRFRALFLANRLTVHLGHADALRTLIRVIESFQTELDSELAEALFRAAGAASALYRTKLSHSLFVRAEEMADSLGLFEWSTESIRGRAEIAANQGLYDQAEILLAKAQARYQETGDSKGEARCLGGLGYIKRELGLFQQSEELTETALALSTANGDDEWRLWCMGSLASTHIAANQPERAIPILQQTLAHQERVGNRPAQNWNRTSLGVAQMQIGDFEDALLNLESVVKNMEHQNEDLTQSWPLLELGELYRRMGRLSEAKATLERSLSLCRLSGSKTLEIRAVLRLGQVSVDMQDMISARAYRTTAAAALCKTNAPALVRDLVRLESMLGSRGEPTPEGLTIENSSGEPPARVAFTS